MDLYADRSHLAWEFFDPILYNRDRLRLPLIHILHHHEALAISTYVILIKGVRVMNKIDEHLIDFQSFYKSCDFKSSSIVLFTIFSLKFRR